jgi:dipeptide/tripeptide permease
LFIQQNNTWVYQAKRLDRRVFGEFALPADLMPSIEDVFVLIFLVFIDAVAKPVLGWYV